MNIIKRSDKIKLICADTFDNSVMINRTYDDIQNKNNGLEYLRDELKLFDMFNAFCANIWEYKERILPLRMNSYDAIQKVANLNIIPCITYIDSSHIYEETKNELNLLKKFFPKH